MSAAEYAPIACARHEKLEYAVLRLDRILAIYPEPA